MPTITYCKGLPTPIEELNSVGLTQFEMFLNAYAPIVHKATCETVNHLLSTEKFNKSSWNTHLQNTYGINKRHANGIISDAQGKIDSAKECRANHIKQLQGKLKNAKSWLSKAEKKLVDGQKFYAKKKWCTSKTGCKFPLDCHIKYGDTNWQHLRFLIHNKKRYIYKLSQQIKHLELAPLRVKVTSYNVFIVGSLDETYGNQVCQWDGDTLTFRVPYCLESKFGEYVSTRIGSFDRNINRLPVGGARTWHFHRKNNRWVVAVQFTPTTVEKVSRSVQYGCIGIDLNPSSIGWAYVDWDGNLVAHGQIPLLMGLPKEKQNAQIIDACLKLAQLGTKYSCPVACEDLDFEDKKEQLREKGRRYARMMSSWAYSRFYELLDSILSNRGISLIKVNPAYTSLIGLVKYARQYALPSDCAAAIAIARRAMNLSEKLPGSALAYLSVKDGKHLWSLWAQLNKKLKQLGVKRHAFYSFSNWESLLKHEVQASQRPLEGLPPQATGGPMAVKTIA